MNGKDVFLEIYNEQVDFFMSAYMKSSRKIFYSPNSRNTLHHSGEFGMYRERIVTKFLRLFTPQRLEFDSGFVIVPDDFLSKQLDIIVYDKSESPLIKSDEGQKFFPMETIASIGEVKSVLSEVRLRDELNNLVRLKRMRESMGNRFRIYSAIPRELDLEASVTKDIPFNPSIFPYDQISTFLICQEFSFQITEQNAHEIIEALYEDDVPVGQRVDFILSLKDGFIGYYNNGQFLLHPATDEGRKIELVPSNKKNDHIKQFVNLYYNRLALTSIAKPELSEYFK